MKRNFGHIDHNHAPVNGYNAAPHFYSERGSRPLPEQQSYYQRQTKFVLPDGVIAPSLDVIDQAIEASPQLGNEALPVFEHKEAITSAISKNQVTIIVGETGSGKSTQVPQFLYEAGYDVQLTQPRRMAAYGVAERIQEELTTSLGKDEARDLVGFQTAEKSTVTKDTRITVLTDGIEHARQFNRKTEMVGTVVVSDEVHEWNTNTEITLAMIKRRVQKFPNERYVLMSATVDAHRIASYFSEVTETMPPVIEVPGRTFPIESHEKPHSTVVDEIIDSALSEPEENILVFVPGKQEISDTIDALRQKLPPRIRHSATILPLHAKLSKEQQDKIYGHYNGIKIIVSTNVAQTSLTIDDIGVVIDCGQERRIELDDEEVQGLHVLPTSQADCDQRKGRTGRTGPGKYVLTRYDADTEYVPYISRPKFGTAEILRTDLSRTVLRTEAGGIDLADLDLFHPVKHSSILLAKDALFRLGALDEDAKITRMGQMMNEFPVKPTSGRMIVESLQYSPQVRAYVAAVAASLEVGGLPYFSRESGKEWQQLTEETSSDFLAQLDIFIAAQDMTDEQLQEHDLDVQNMKRARELQRKIAFRSDAAIGSLITPSLSEKEQIQTAVCAGYIDWIYMHAGSGNYELVSQVSESQVREISNRSVVHKQQPHLILGTPYRVEFWKKGLPETKHIIEGINIIEDPQILGRVAIDALIETVPDKVIWSAGKLMQVTRQKFNGVIDLGIEGLREAPVNPYTTSLVREQLLNRPPGPAQRQLRTIKKQLEELQTLTKVELPKLTQQGLIDLIDQAIKVAGFDAQLIDKELAKIIQSENISVEKYVASKKQDIIRAQSPKTQAINGNMVELAYSNGRPRVKPGQHLNLSEMPDELKLPDGREILLRHEKGWLTIGQLREKLALTVNG